MNEKSQGQRHFTRFSVEREGDASWVTIKAPALSAEPIIPEDISTGGFRIKAGKAPAPGEDVSFSIRIGETEINGCTCQVAWTEENSGQVNGWTLGLSANLTEDQRDLLASHITEVLSEGKGKEKSPMDE